MDSREGEVGDLIIEVGNEESKSEKSYIVGCLRHEKTNKEMASYNSAWKVQYSGLRRASRLDGNLWRFN
jgi:hypothetical protein